MTANANCSFGKEINPYEYMDSWGKFKETSLPSIKHSIAISTCLELVIQPMSTPALFGKNLELGIWENTTIYT